MVNNRIQERVSKLDAGIAGFDIITYGGIPRNRTTLITGNPKLIPNLEETRLKDIFTDD